MFEFTQLGCFFGMTQPPLSRQVQLLEHELGVKLFERSSPSVRLTSAGRIFLPEARQMLQLAVGATATAKWVARDEAGTLTLGFTAGASYAFLPRLATIAMAEMPDVDLILREMTTADQMEALAGGRLDAGMVRLPVDRRGAELECVVREPLILAAPEHRRAC
jgi:DNA-binding transcriptional LysR family regulator